MLARGLAIALAVLGADQLSKGWLIDLLEREQGAIELTPFFNLVMVWNRGVSFGLFNTGEPEQRWILIALALVMVAVLLVWLRRVTVGWVALAIGLVIGGAVGNVVDRLRYGAVADFFDFHLGGWHWPAFNIADSGIVLGVALLVIDALFGGPEADKRRA